MQGLRQSQRAVIRLDAPTPEEAAALAGLVSDVFTAISNPQPKDQTNGRPDVAR